jgi:hypothetical protein
MFLPRMDDDLRWFFGGEYLADMGLRSWMGPVLDHAEAAYVSEKPVEWSGRGPMPDQVAFCGKNLTHSPWAQSYEMGAREIFAVSRERRIRAALSILPVPEARMLAASYAPQLPNAPDGLRLLGEHRAMVVAVISEERARALVMMIAAKADAETPEAHKDAIRGQRDVAKAELAAAKSAASHLLEKAKESYGNADGIARRAERDAKARRSVGGQA